MSLSRQAQASRHGPLGKGAAPKAEAIGMMPCSDQNRLLPLPGHELWFCPMKNHGKKIMGGLAEAVAKINDLVGGLLTLSELHALQMRVDPTNYNVTILTWIKKLVLFTLIKWYYL
ncbi:hypothetical protein AOLI_G00129940 [Acnodon oligacanthus]